MQLGCMNPIAFNSVSLIGVVGSYLSNKFTFILFLASPPLFPSSSAFSNYKTIKKARELLLYYPTLRYRQTPFIEIIKTTARTLCCKKSFHGVIQ